MLSSAVLTHLSANVFNCTIRFNLNSSSYKDIILMKIGILYSAPFYTIYSTRKPLTKMLFMLSEILKYTRKKYKVYTGRFFTEKVLY